MANPRVQRHLVILMLVAATVVVTGATTLGWVRWQHRAAARPQVPTVFTARACEFSVTFPGAPTVDVQSHPAVGSFEQAIWSRPSVHDAVALRSECVSAPGIGAAMLAGDPEAFLLSQLESFSTSNGLDASEFRYAVRAYGHTGRLSGTKQVDGAPVTFQVLLVAGHDSLLSLYAGGATGGYPQAEVPAFLASVQLAEL